MRLAQLSAAYPARHALLQNPRTRIRAWARHVRPAWIRRRAPQGAGEMAGGHERRSRPHLRQMQSAGLAVAAVGPRPHRRPQVLDRPRTSKLQSKRRTAQSDQQPRAMALTSASAVRLAMCVALVRRAIRGCLEDVFGVVVSFPSASGARPARVERAGMRVRQEILLSGSFRIPLGGYPSWWSPDRR